MTCSLTPAKIKEFQHMKVVRPEWLVESAKAGVLLPWQNFIFKVSNRPEDTQGRRIAQKTLFDAYTPSARPSDSEPIPGLSPIPVDPPLQQKAPPVIPSQESEDSLVADVSSLSSHPSASGSQPTKLPEVPSDSDAGPSGRPQTPERDPLLYLTDPSTPEQAKRIPGYAAHKSNPHAQRAMQDPLWRAAHTSVAPDFIEGFYKNSRLHHLSTWKAELKNLVAEAQERADNGGEFDVTGLHDARGVTGDDEGDSAVKKITRENMGGKGAGWDKADGILGRGASEDSVTMRDAQLVMRSPSRKGKEKERTDERCDEDTVIMHCDFDSFFVSAGLVDRPHLKGKPVVVCHSQGGQGGQSSTSEIASASYEARKFGIKSGMRYNSCHNMSSYI